MSALPLITVLLAIATLTFLASNASKGRDRFSFRLTSIEKAQSDANYLVVTIVGDIQNKSTRANSLSEVYLVSWWQDRLGAALFEPRPDRIECDGELITLPLRFDGKQDKKVTLRWSVPLGDRETPRHLEVALEDSSGLLHDQQGRLRNRRNVERRLELATFFSRMSSGGIRPALRVHVAIRWSDWTFSMRRLFWFIGL